MANNIFQARVKQNIEDVKSVISNAFNQILNREFDFAVDYSDKTDINSQIAAQAYPLVAVGFNSGTAPKRIRHILLFEPEFILNFYAWMLMEDAAEEITEEHFDGLKEGLEQVFGQIKMAVTDENGTFNFDNIDVLPAESFDSIQQLALEGEGAYSTFTLTTDGQVYHISQFSWPENPDQFIDVATVAADDKKDEEVLKSESSVEIQSAEFGSISSSGSTPGDSQNVNMLMDVELEIRVEIDRKTILVSDLLKLGKGSIVEMEKSAGEPLDVFVNGRKFAEGEVVVVDDRFGIRITQLLSPKDRVKSLGPAF